MTKSGDQPVALGYAPAGGPRGGAVPAVALQVAILAAILGAHYRHVIDRLVHIWSTDGDWSHGFIIPLFSLYYLYTQGYRLPRGVADRGLISRLAGAALLVAGLGLHVGSMLARMEYPKTLSLVVSLMGVVLIVGGWPVARWSWFAVAFLVFALPLPVQLYQQMTMPLREIATKVSGMVLSMVPDMTAEAQGTVVEYIYRGRTGVLDIERACSGMRLMVTMSALGVAMAFVNERLMWQRLVMILSCVPIAIFCNIVRVTTTGFLVVFGREELARGVWHTLLGLGMLAIAFSLYGGISYVLGHLFVEGGPEEGNDERVIGGVTE
jgi:exosortase